MRVIKEAVDTEKKRIRTARNGMSDETTKRTERAKTLIVDIKLAD